MEYRFLDFTLDSTTGALEGPDGEIRLRPKTQALLEILVAEAPAVLARDELMDRVWGQEHLGETSLAQAISELRRALGDDPRQPRIIETLHRRGYRFIAPFIETKPEDPWETLPAALEEPEDLAPREDPLPLCEALSSPPPPGPRGALASPWHRWAALTAVAARGSTSEY